MYKRRIIYTPTKSEEPYSANCKNNSVGHTQIYFHILEMYLQETRYCFDPSFLCVT